MKCGKRDDCIVLARRENHPVSPGAWMGHCWVDRGYGRDEWQGYKYCMCRFVCVACSGDLFDGGYPVATFQALNNRCYIACTE